MNWGANKELPLPRRRGGVSRVCQLRQQPAQRQQVPLTVQLCS